MLPDEDKCFYHGLPSRPVLVFRTGAPWERPFGPEEYLVPKEARPVFDRRIAAVWDEMGTRIFRYLDSAMVMWTTIDVVRFAEDEKDPGPIVLWIGVKPESLSYKDAQVAAGGCEKILDSFKITGIDIAFRESLFTRSGPRLLDYVFSVNATAGFRGPLTPALGLPIASRATTYAEGTGAVYISEGPNDGKVYILTARHVLFPPPDMPNTLYNHSQVNAEHYEVILPGPKAFQTTLSSIVTKIDQDQYMIYRDKCRLRKLQSGVRANEDDLKEWRVVEGHLREAKVSIKALYQFHKEVTRYWSDESERIIGHIVYSPAITIGAGTECYTEDWALIELDHTKIDWDNFRGNVIDLGMEIPVSKFMSMMRCSGAYTFFPYPFDRLLPVHGVITENELCHPRTHDANGEPCLIVIKNGCTTGTTIGRATGIKSFVRQYFPDGSHETSMEWAILGYNRKEGAFSAPGDSGAIIVDGQGRIGGLLTGSSGLSDSADITYGTPFWWLLERIRTHFPNADLYQSPVLADW